jgi:hypothetical protein
MTHLPEEDRTEYVSSFLNILNKEEKEKKMLQSPLGQLVAQAKEEINLGQTRSLDESIDEIITQTEGEPLSIAQDNWH